MTLIDFGLRRLDELVDEVIGLHSEAFAAGDFDVGTAAVFFGDVVAEIEGAARRKRAHLGGEVRVVVGLLGVAEAAQGFDDIGLGIGLTRIDDVVDGLGSAEERMVGSTAFSGDPALAIGIGEEALVAEVAAEQAKLPKVIGDVLAYIGHRAVGANDHLGVFIGCQPHGR